MIRTALILLGLLLGTLDVWAYPITPQTLRKQIENSPLIVVAHIDNPDPPPRKERRYNPELKDTVDIFTQLLGGDGIAHLNICKVLKGTFSGDHLEVAYPAYLSNPRPPWYPNGRMVIAFLTPNDTAGNFVTVGLSYGTIVFDPEQSTAWFEELIRDYLPISTMSNQRKKKELTASWLVKCCQKRISRWNGAYELVRERHWQSYYDRSEDEHFARYLSDEEKAVLEAIVLNSDTISYNELCLSEFVTPENQERLKEILVFNLRFYRKFFSEDFMKRYLEIEDNPELRSVLKEFEDLDITSKKNKDKARELNDRFIEIAERG